MGPQEYVRTRARRVYRAVRPPDPDVPTSGDGADAGWLALAADAPVAVREVELGRPLPRLDALLHGRHAVAHVLVRLHGQPLGVVLARVGDALPELLSARLGDVVARHLRADRLPSTTTVPADGLGELPAPPCRAPAPQRSTSVVIPTVGRPSYVVDLVRSLLAGDAVPDEVLVVDNRPGRERTGHALALAFGTDPRVRYVAEPTSGASLARNRGLRAARGELVAFLDDDVAVDAGWLAAVHRAWAATPDVGCVTGPILPAELETPAQLLTEAYGGFDKGFTRRVFDLRDNRLDHPLFPYLVGAYGSGANAVFDRAMLRDRGGFDPRLGPGTPTRAGEDLDVLLQTVLDGRAIAYEPGALVRHHHRRDYADLRGMAGGYGVGLSALFVKHLLASPRSFLAIARRLPAGLNLLLRPDSTRNAGRRELSYPAELTLRELVGMTHGPLAFARSCWDRRRVSSPSP